MSQPDWIVLGLTLLAIVTYGLYKSKTTKDLDGYFLSNRTMPWYLILLSIMGTQASAITFLSAPGQAYTDGMRFVQYYFGLPLAMVVLCITFVPIFHKLKVITAYEYLENRFDVKTRTIEIAPLAYMRGRTLDHAFIILDEAQNATDLQIKMFLTRIGAHAKAIITGDLTQVDLPKNQRSGLEKAVRILHGVDGIAHIELNEEDVVRHRLVKAIIRAYEHEKLKEQQADRL